MRRLHSAALFPILLAATASAEKLPDGLYALDPAASSVSVHVYRAGLLGGLGHNHTVAHRSLSGCARVAEDGGRIDVSLAFPVAEFEVDDAEDRRAAGEAFPVPVPEDDIEATRENMLGERLLDAGRQPEIRLRATDVVGDWPDYDAGFEIGIAGSRQALSFPVTLEQNGERVTARGARPVEHDELGLKPFTAALGTLRVAKEMDFEYVLEFDPAPGTGSACELAFAVVDDDGVALADDGAE